jgi:hypothetical protein
MFALAIVSWAAGPIAPFVLVESESVRKTKESRLIIMNDGSTVSEEKERRDVKFPAGESKGLNSLARPPGIGLAAFLVLKKLLQGLLDRGCDKLRRSSAKPQIGRTNYAWITVLDLLVKCVIHGAGVKCPHKISVHEKLAELNNVLERLSPWLAPHGNAVSHRRAPRSGGRDLALHLHSCCAIQAFASHLEQPWETRLSTTASHGYPPGDT